MNLGSPVRPASGMTPLLLADGTRAVAWTDANEAESVPPYSGRTHLAVEGAADAPRRPRRRSPWARRATAPCADPVAPAADPLQRRL